MKTIKYFIEAFVIYFFFLLIKLLGLNISRIFFSFLFKKVGPLIRSNKIPNKNLSIFSNNISNEEKKDIISCMWSNYGMTFVEYIFLKKFRKNQNHIEIEGVEILDMVLEDDKPAIFISGHFANFELMSMEITKRKLKLATIYRPLNNFFLNPFMEFLRKKYVCKNQIKKGIKGVKETIEFIKNKHSIALMVDQRVSEGDKIKFFNDEAFTTTLPGQLAIKYNLNIIPIFLERKDNKFFKMKVFDPIKTSNFKDKLEITNKLNQIIESMIIKNPKQWIWTHNRWK